MKRYDASFRASFKTSFGASFCALFYAMLLCAAALTACAQNGGDVPALPEPPVGMENTSGTPGTLPFPVGTLRTLSWGSNEGGFYGCNSGTAYYSIVQSNVFVDTSGIQWEDWLILRTDYETRAQTPLCSVPGCMHTDDSCPAFLRSRGSMEYFYITFTNGRLYVLHNYWYELAQRSDAGSKPTVWLETAALDGSGRTRLMTLPPEWQLSNQFLLTDGTALYGQYWDYTNMSRHGIRVELKSGDYTTFSFGLGNGEDLVGAVDSRFLLSRSNGILPELAYPDIIGGYELYRLPNHSSPVFNTKELVLLDPAAGTRRSLNELLPPAGEDESLQSTFFQQGRFYCTTGVSSPMPQMLWQIDFAKNESRALMQHNQEWGDGWWTVRSLTLFPSDSCAEEPYIYGSYWMDEDHQGFLLDLRDGTVLPIALRYEEAYYGTSPVVPLAQTDGGMWLVQTAEVPTPWGRYRFLYALAAPETVISGEGEMYPIEMWATETPLG